MSFNHLILLHLWLIYNIKEKLMETKTTIDGALRVKELLKGRGLKMKEFAEQIGVAPETLTRALNNNPQYSTLKQIADGLGVEVRDLFVTSSKEAEIDGYIEFQGIIYRIKTRDDFNTLAAKIQSKAV
jgi:transcriptional regulator with XRE-family HTH domain